MNNIFESIKSGYFVRKNTAKESLSTKKIIKEIRSVVADLACADTRFQFEEDSDMLEACIYYTESLKARYRYLIKKAKLNNIKISALN